MTELPEPIPAATLVLLHQSAHALELLAVERAGSMVFAPGAIVFPGGRVDADDHVVAERFGRARPHQLLDFAAARVAAIRETLEETGIAAGFTTTIGAEQAEAMRMRLKQGENFSGLVEEADLALDLAALVPFARWCPNMPSPRRFDTIFFIAEAPADAPPPSADDAECEHAFWASARRLLDDFEEGLLQIVFPTRRNLERLAQFDSMADARAHALAHPVKQVQPWIEDRDGVQWLCLPRDLGYPITEEPLESALAAERPRRDQTMSDRSSAPS